MKTDEDRLLEFEEIMARRESEAYHHSLAKTGKLDEELAIRLAKESRSSSTNLGKLSYIDCLIVEGESRPNRSMAEAIADSIHEIKNDRIRDAFSYFRNAEHRLEKVAVIRGVEFVNDSKATNINAAWYAMESIDRPIIWIAGGMDKGNDYTPLIPIIERRVKLIIIIGSNAMKIHKAFGGKVDLIVNSSDMNEAAKMALYLSSPGDTVLLSPACASFDQFEDYRDRGRQFKNAVKQLQ